MLAKDNNMEEKYLVSVIVPVYKVEKYLDRCVKSIINQTYKNLEIILVDDGSPDNCPKLCDEWAKKDARIKVVHKENGGLSDARNKGFDASNGDLILFVDSDDYIDNNMVEIMAKRIEEDGTDMCVCSFSKFRDGEEPNKSFSKSPEILTTREALQRLVLGKGFQLVVAWDKLMKRKLVEKVKFPKGKIHEDEYICHRFIGECEKVSIIHNPLYFYFLREGSIMNSTFSMRRLDVIGGLDDRVAYFSEVYPDLTQAVKIFTLKGIMALYCNARIAKAEKKIIKTIRKEYKEHYKKTEKKSFKTILGRYFPNVYYLLYKVKNKINGNV